MWKSKNVLKEMIGRWYMISKWKGAGKFIWVLAQCKEFEENKDGWWWAEFRDMDSYPHYYNQKTIEKIMGFLKSIPDEKLRQYLDLFNLHG